MKVRRLLIGFLLGLTFAVLPATAEGGHHHFHHFHADRLIRTITLTREGAGSLISVTFAGHAHPRVLRSPEPIAAVALADLDRDGDLDIVAASNAKGLQIWRNAGSGHFVLVPPLRHGIAPDGRANVRPSSRIEEGLLALDDRVDAAMPRAPAVAAPTVSRAFVRTVVVFPAAVQNTTRSGRAPPTYSSSRSV